MHAFDRTEVSSFGGEAIEFYDQGHVTARNAALVMASVARGDGDLCGSTEPGGKG
ncbi:MAG TPA: hypothetical protein VM286_06955 [Candidatus Thermoplasmatota archaeon]|nr:hypothetical protein [Candidatus Thermoplasmatota archaeon]